MSAEDLARHSSLGVTTIRRAELTEGATSITVSDDLAVRRSLEAAGVEFIRLKMGVVPGSVCERPPARHQRVIDSEPNNLKNAQAHRAPGSTSHPSRSVS